MSDDVIKKAERVENLLNNSCDMEWRTSSVGRVEARNVIRDLLAVIKQSGGVEAVNTAVLWRQHHATYDTKISHYEFDRIVQAALSAMPNQTQGTK